MGKLINFLMILIFVDILFIVTGQIGGNSPSSIIFNAILDPSSVQTTTFWTAILGTAGIAGLVTIAAVSVGFITGAGQITLFITMAITLAGLVGDYISIYNILQTHSEVLALIIMAPIIIIFVFTIVEWLRGKD